MSVEGDELYSLLVPLYDVFCDITGLNGKTGRIDAQAAAERYQADPDFGAAQVLQNGNRLIELSRNGPYQDNFIRVIRMGAVGEIESGHIHAVLDHRPYRVGGTAGRSDRTYDFRLWHAISSQALVRAGLMADEIPLSPMVWRIVPPGKSKK